MPIDENILLYSLANTFNTTLGVTVSDDTKIFIKNNTKKFSKLDTNGKMYYTKYSINVAQNLFNYLENIKLFEINTDEDNEILHDFKLIWGKDNTAYISMSHASINVKDLIPEKLMKICKYKRNTKICQSYTEKYRKICENAYKKFSDKKKYSVIPEKQKNKNLLNPVCNLVVDTLSKKRKCAANFYNYLFNENNRIVLKLYKNRFTIYDFTIDLKEVESFKMKLNPDNEIIITFNNGVEFGLVLQTNSAEIKEHISLKFHTNMKNMDDIFSIANSTI